MLIVIKLNKNKLNKIYLTLFHIIYNKLKYNLLLDEQQYSKK